MKECLVHVLVIGWGEEKKKTVETLLVVLDLVVRDETDQRCDSVSSLFLLDSSGGGERLRKLDAQLVSVLRKTVIDGLDECEDRRIQQRIIKLFIEAISKLPVKLLVASRLVLP